MTTAEQGSPGVEPVDRKSERVRLGARIRDLRLLAGLSQQAVADSLGVSRATVNRLEMGTGDSGIGDLGMSRVIELATLFGVDPSAFWDEG